MDGTGVPCSRRLSSPEGPWDSIYDESVPGLVRVWETSGTVGGVDTGQGVRSK